MSQQNHLTVPRQIASSPPRKKVRQVKEMLCYTPTFLLQILFNDMTQKLKTHILGSTGAEISLQKMAIILSEPVNEIKQQQMAQVHRISYLCKLCKNK